MSTQPTTGEYIELSKDTYGLVLDTLTAATRARLAFWNSVWEIASRPYSSAALEQALKETFNRVNELTNVTISELGSRVQRTADFSEKFFTQVEKLQDLNLETYRNSLKWSSEKLEEIKESSTQALATAEKSALAVAEDVNDTSREVSVEGITPWKTPANPISASN